MPNELVNALDRGARQLGDGLGSRGVVIARKVRGVTCTLHRLVPHGTTGRGAYHGVMRTWGLLAVALSVVAACATDGSNETLTKETTSSAASGTGGAGGATTSSAGGATSSSSTGGNGGEANTERPAFSSGSRLRARIYTGSDGSEQRVGFHDTQTDEICWVATASDGVLRCLPAGFGIVLYFTDSGCTQRAVLTTKGCTPTSAYVRANVSSGGSCPTGWTAIHSLGAAASAAALFQGDPSNCIAVADLSATYDAWTLGAEVAPSTFVEMTESVE